MTSKTPGRAGKRGRKIWLGFCLGNANGMWSLVSEASSRAILESSLNPPREDCSD
jgi:hypothetical protein